MEKKERETSCLIVEERGRAGEMLVEKEEEAHPGTFRPDRPSRRARGLEAARAQPIHSKKSAAGVSWGSEERHYLAHVADG